ncbi:hypothetical protein ACEN2S_17470 [Phaeovulum sp. W22_SRMD_FR3]
MSNAAAPFSGAEAIARIRNLIFAHGRADARRLDDGRRLRMERLRAKAPMIARSCAISRCNADLAEYRLDAPAIALRPWHWKQDVRP